MADETRTIAWQLVVETKGIEENTARASNSLSSLTSSVKTLYTGLAAIAAGTVVRGLVDFADTFTRVQNSVRLATTSTEEFNATQRALTESALASSTPLETVATNYARLRASLESYRVTGRDVITVSDTITKAVKLQGGSADQAEQAVRMMAKAFDTGTISARELKSMLDTSRPLVQALADAMTKGSIPALQLLAKNGKLTGQDILKALGDAAAGIDEKFKQRVTPLSEAFTNLKTTLLDVFGDAVAKQIQEIANNIAKFGEALPGIIQTFQELGIHVKYGWQLTLNDVKNLWEILKAYVVKYVADIGAILVGLIPDWAADLSPQVAAFKKHYTELAQIKQADLDKTRKVYEQTQGFIITNRNTELKAISTKAAAQKAADEAVLNKPLEGGGGGGGAGAQAASDFEKALASLQGELDRVRDRSAALTIEITRGAQASAEYTIRADARRKIEEQILSQAQAGKPYSEAEIATLQAKSAAVAEATVQMARYENANKLVQAAINAGMTPQERAAKLLVETEQAFAELQKRSALTAEQIKFYNAALKDMKEKADPAYQSNKIITDMMTQQADETAKLTIAANAQVIALRDGEAAARAYTNEAEAQLAIDQKLRDAKKDGTTFTDAQVKSVREGATAAANAKTANEDMAKSMQLINDAAQFGVGQQEALRIKIDETKQAIAYMQAQGADSKAIAAAQAGLKQMETQANDLKVTFQDAALQMGSALVDFVINGTQSFGEFAASVIKNIGQMVAQLFMLKAIKMALGMPLAQGGVVEGGRLLAFQHGGLVTGPTTFPLARGERGLMGEAGPEAIMPLARLPGGDLGVQAQAQPLNLEVINQTGVNATARVQRDQDRTQLILEAAELGATMAQSRFTTSVNSGYGASATSMQRTYGLTRRKA